MGNNVLFKAVNQVEPREINKYRTTSLEDTYFGFFTEVTNI